MYKVKVKWHDDYEEKDVESCVIVCARSYSEAMSHIMNEFEYIGSVEISELQPVEKHVVYIPNEMFESVSEENYY